MSRTKSPFRILIFLMALFILIPLGNIYEAYASGSKCKDDHTPPEIQCKTVDVWLDKYGRAKISISHIIAKVTDNCSSSSAIKKTVSQTEFSCCDLDKGPDHSPVLGQVQVIVYATDENGNTGTCTTWVNVHYKPYMSVKCKSSLSFAMGDDCSVTITPEMIIYKSSSSSSSKGGACDNDNMYHYTVEPSVLTGAGYHEVTLTATDDYGNTASCSTKVKLIDKTPPLFTSFPNDMTAETGPDDTECGTRVYWDEPIAEDNCGDVEITSNYKPGDILPGGKTYVEYKAKDAAGNYIKRGFYVVVFDKTPPVFENCPEDIVVTLSSGSSSHSSSSSSSSHKCLAKVSWGSIKVKDNCTSSVKVTGNYKSGGYFPVGTTTVIMAATDKDGNSSTCSFTVTVKDNTPPVVTGCPKDMIVDAEKEGDECGAHVNWIPPVIKDDCECPKLVSDYEPGDFFPVGTTTVNYTVDCPSCDEHPVVCTFDITVKDNTPPVIADCPEDITVNGESQNGDCGAEVTWDPPTAEDNCSDVTMTSNYNPGDFFPVGTTTVTYTATDEGGSKATCSFKVTVTDHQPPEISGCPDDITVDAEAVDSHCGAEVTWDPPTAVDNCGDVDMTSNYQPGDFFPAGTTTVIYTAKDDGGNEATCEFTVTVIDNEPPEILHCPADITVTASSSSCKAKVSWTPPTATDNCSSHVTLTSDHKPGDYFNVGETLVTYTATDEAGNEATCEFMVTVKDSKPPVILHCPTDITVDAEPQGGQCGAEVTWTPPTATDNCGSVDLTSDYKPGDFFPVGTTTVTYTATDQGGNETTCSFDVTVNDNEPPEILDCPEDITVAGESQNGDCGAEVTWDPPTAMDNCGDAEMTSNYNPGDFFPVGTTTVIYTATDQGGNEATCTFTVTVTDNQPPEIFDCPRDLMVVAEQQDGECGAEVTWDPPTAEDNCGDVEMTSNYQPGDFFPVGTTTVIYTAKDDGGNEATCEFTVTVTDDEPPEILHCPADITVTASSSSCKAKVSWTPPTAVDNCGGGNVTLTSNHKPGEYFNVGITLVVYTATDEAGNEATCEFMVTVKDSKPPVILHCPSDITVDAEPQGGQCGAEVTWTPPTATDNCGSVDLISDYQPGDFFPVGTTTVTYTATDQGGNETTCSFDVTVNDNEPPEFYDCPDDITVDGESQNGECGAEVTWDPPTAIDNCGDAEMTSNYNPGDFFPVGTTTVIYTATDQGGNEATCTFTVTVTDNQPPEISGCPGDITVDGESLDGECGAEVTWDPPTAVDNCGDVDMTSNYQPGDFFPIGETTVIYTATDDGGNEATCEFIVTVLDNAPPEIMNCPSDITVTATGTSCKAKVTWTPPTAVDNCGGGGGGGVTLTSNYKPGDYFNVGETLVIYTATDQGGNEATCEFTVTVRDSKPPVIVHCPSDITVDAEEFGGECGAEVTWTPPTATDNCGSVDLTSDYQPGDFFPVGTTTVTYTATDQGGNEATCTFDVTVLDNQPPVIYDCPGDISVDGEPQDGQCGAEVWWDPPTAVDNCGGGSVELTSNYEPGDMFPVGTTTVTYTATDEGGNEATCEFTVTVTDNEPPEITNMPDDIVIGTGENATECATEVWWDPPTVIDNCGNGEAELTSDYQPGDIFPVGTTIVTYTATDEDGNTAEASFTITVFDDTPPKFLCCPHDTVITLSSTNTNCGINVRWCAPTAEDNCSDVTLTSDHQNGSFFPVGITTVTYTATDESGNESTCSFTVTVKDTKPPVIVGGPADITLYTGAYATICGAIARWTPPTATDNCGTPTMTSNHKPADTFAIGPTIVIYTATDASGNKTTYSFKVTVIDNTLPVITGCPANIVIGSGSGSTGCGTTVRWTPPVATDNCSGVTMISNFKPGDFFPVGTTTVIYTATDGAGNKATCTFTVKVTENTPPVFSCCPGDIIANASVQTGNCGANVTWRPPTASDNCGTPTVTSNHKPGDFFPTGNTTVTYTATDAAGNTATCSFTVTVYDNIPPVLTCCPPDMVVYTGPYPAKCGKIVTWTPPTATDNCGTPTLTSNYKPGDYFPVGTTTVTYTATDASHQTATCSFKIKVIDNTPPIVCVKLSPTYLWPPNHDLRTITAELSVNEKCPMDDCMKIELYSVTSSECDSCLGRLDKPKDIQNANKGAADYSFDLRAERNDYGNGRKYTIKYKVTDCAGNVSYHTSYISVPLQQPKDPDLPLEGEPLTDFGIDNIYPNPFGQSTTITFSVPESENVSLAISNSTGRIVKELEGVAMPAGTHSIMWDGTDSDGYALANGIYYVTLKSGTYTTTMVLTLVR